MVILLPASDLAFRSERTFAVALWYCEVQCVLRAVPPTRGLYLVYQFFTMHLLNAPLRKLPGYEVCINIDPRGSPKVLITASFSLHTYQDV